MVPLGSLSGQLEIETFTNPKIIRQSRCSLSCAVAANMQDPFTCIGFHSVVGNAKQIKVVP